MAKRETAPGSAQRAAQLANLAKGRQAKKDIAAAAREDGLMKAKDRWAMLIAGTLTVKDLDDKEVEKMKVRNADGTMGGKRRAIPSHLIQQFTQEQLVRANAKMRRALPETINVLVEILNDGSAKHSDRLRAAQMLQDRILGKAPETVRIQEVNEWDSMFTDAVDIDRNGLDAEAAALLDDA